MKNDIIINMDEYKIFDKIETERRRRRFFGPLGFVQILLKTKRGIVYDEGWNLVVAQGRQYVTEKIAEVLTKCNGGTLPNYLGYKVSHFAIGQGGTIVNNNEYELKGPYVCNTCLNSAIQLKGPGSSYLTEPGGGGVPPVPTVPPTPYAVKPVVNDGGSICVEAKGYDNDPPGSGQPDCTYYTKVKFHCIIPPGEPDYLLPGGTVKVDEAGLYFVSGTDVKLFAHICFAPKWKEKESQLEIIWYILC